MLHTRRSDTGLVLPRGSACLKCKDQKRKCDAKKPACATCIRLGRSEECIYPPPGKRTEIKKLNDKVDELEARLRLTDAALSEKRALKTHAKKTVSSRRSSPVDIAIAPEILFMDQSVEWWKLDELPWPMRDFLLNTFIAHAPQSHFEDLFPSIFTRMSLYSPSNPHYPHAALLNAMFLIASFYLTAPAHPAKVTSRIKWHPSEVEVSFLKRAKILMKWDEVHPEDVFDYFLASTLVSRWFYFVKRHGEGLYEGNGTMRLAMACNLHSITSPQIKDAPPSPLPLPSSSQQLVDRMNAFWIVFVLDRGGCVCNGLGVSFPDEHITTTFPPSPSDPRLQDPAYQFEPLTLTSLVMPNSPAVDTSTDTNHVRRVKYSSLMERTRRLTLIAAEQGAKELKNTTPEFRYEFRQTEISVRHLISTLPELPPFPSPLNPSFEAQFADLALVHTLAWGTLIRLHAIFPLEGSESREKVVKAAKMITGIAEILEGIHEIWWQIPINMAWGNACEVFQQEIRRLLRSAPSLDQVGLDKEYKILELRNDMEFFVNLTKRFLKVYRFHHASLYFLQDLLARDADAVKQLLASHPSPSSTPSSSNSSAEPRSPAGDAREPAVNALATPAERPQRPVVRKWVPCKFGP